tara:strand:+ start:264 stop:569 length:306 start_codon:yes stop_codon:yes gene_type:complete
MDLRIYYLVVIDADITSHYINFKKVMLHIFAKQYDDITLKLCQENLALDVYKKKRFWSLISVAIANEHDYKIEQPFGLNGTKYIHISYDKYKIKFRSNHVY